MRNQPLLTISIPTFNRATYLDAALTQLESELSAIGVGNFIEIIVSDNASTDHTADVVLAAQRRGMLLRYIRNKDNLGSDVNIAQCFNEAAGRYVIIMGDDDLFIDGALLSLIRHLRRAEYGMICLKPYGFESDFRAELPASFAGYQEFSEPGPYLSRVAHLVTLLSACVINKSLLPNVDARAFCGRMLVQVHLCVMAALRAKQNLLINNYQIAVKRNNSGGYEHSKVFVTNFFGILDEFVGQGLTFLDIRRIERRFLLSYLPFYIFKLMLAHGDLAQAKQEFSARFKGRFFYKIWLEPVFYLPRSLAIVWAALITVIGRIAGGDLLRGLFYLKNYVKVKIK